MIRVSQIDINDKTQVDRFIQFHYDLYKGCPQWVPPFWTDIRAMMNPKKHPYYDHSDADFFIAVRDGKSVARRAAINRSMHTIRQRKYSFTCLMH
jgi:hypothetical protein